MKFDIFRSDLRTMSTFFLIFMLFEISISAPPGGVKVHLPQNTVSEECRDLLDIIVVVDGSDSITAKDFLTLKQALVDLMDGLRLADDQAKFGAVLFSSDVSEKIPLSADRRELKRRLLSMSHPRDGTRTDLGIKGMRDMFANEGRPNVPQVAVVITDGISKNPNQTAAQAKMAQDEGIQMFAVGVSQLIDKGELDSIASNGSNVLSVSSFDQLKLVFQPLVLQVCPTTTTTTTTPTTTPARTTTTPAPTTTTTLATTTTVPSTTKPFNPCDHCKMSNGAGFTRHPTDCSKFVQCYFGNAGLKKMVYQECPWGNFWDQDTLTCKPAYKVKCPTDKCLDPQVLTHPLAGSCRSFWACDLGESIPMCCPMGSYYSPGLGCLPDENCKDPCPPRGRGHPSSKGVKLLSKETAIRKDAQNDKADMPACDKKPVRGDPNSFEQFVQRYGWIKMPCAPGTKYDSADCECTGRAKYQVKKTCKSKVKLNFKGFEDEIDKSPVYVVNNNVSFSRGVARFNGHSRLRIPQLSNVDYGESVVLKIKFRDEKTNSVRPQAIITNADCGNNASLYLAKDNEKILFGVSTENGEYGQVAIPLPKEEWKNVKYTYNSGLLEGNVNNIHASQWIPRGGKIQPRPCALQIGHGEDFDDFEGDIEDLEIFTECIPDEELKMNMDFI